MSTTTNAANTTNATNATFDGIHVSKGFVRGLQGQVLRLEQILQSLIQQLEHANKLASEYHAAAVSWQHKYDDVLHEMNETRHAAERETLLRINREHEISHLKHLLQEQLAFSSNSPSPSPDHPHHHHPCEPMSPVSISSSPRPNNRMVIIDDVEEDAEDAEDAEDVEEDESIEENDNGETNERYDDYYRSYQYSPRSSQTTDCSGDPICHSDTDSD